MVQFRQLSRCSPWWKCYPLILICINSKIRVISYLVMRELRHTERYRWRRRSAAAAAVVDTADEVAVTRSLLCCDDARCHRLLWVYSLRTLRDSDSLTQSQQQLHKLQFCGLQLFIEVKCKAKIFTFCYFIHFVKKIIVKQMKLANLSAFIMCKSIVSRNINLKKPVKHCEYRLKPVHCTKA